MITAHLLVTQKVNWNWSTIITVLDNNLFACSSLAPDHRLTRLPIFDPDRAHGSIQNQGGQNQQYYKFDPIMDSGLPFEVEIRQDLNTFEWGLYSVEVSSRAYISSLLFKIRNLPSGPLISLTLSKLPEKTVTSNKRWLRRQCIWICAIVMLLRLVSKQLELVSYSVSLENPSCAEFIVGPQTAGMDWWIWLIIVLAVLAFVSK